MGRIFFPGEIEAHNDVRKNGTRFAYYTSAETALKVIANSELWFRNANVMNDFSEIQYGLCLIERAFRGETGKKFRDAVDDIFEGTINQSAELYAQCLNDWKLETFIACISIHDSKEDFSGRLSMWRAYGDTALIIKNTPMVAITDASAVFSTRVKYFSDLDFDAYLSRVTNNILIERTYLKELGQETLVGYIHHMFFRTAIATKHPGFAEEQEWRIFYRPNDQRSPLMEKRIEVIGGIPQTIYVLTLKHDPKNGLLNADIPSLLDRVIVGPTAFPYVSVQALRSVLAEAGVDDPSGKVIASDIPLRK